MQTYAIEWVKTAHNSRPIWPSNVIVKTRRLILGAFGLGHYGGPQANAKAYLSTNNYLHNKSNSNNNNNNIEVAIFIP